MDNFMRLNQLFKCAGMPPIIYIPRFPRAFLHLCSVARQWQTTIAVTWLDHKCSSVSPALQFEKWLRPSLLTFNFIWWLFIWIFIYHRRLKRGIEMDLLESHYDCDLLKVCHVRDSQQQQQAIGAAMQQFRWKERLSRNYNSIVWLLGMGLWL